MPRPAGFVLPTLGEVRTRTVTIEDKDLDRALDMALLHGDLWSGNYLEAGDEPVVFDPAVYYGEREMEVAYIELFGGFPARVLAAYEEAYPLPPDYPKRRTLHQLYHLLNRLNHSGGSYGSDVDAACRDCLR
jgi:fructosamine-3-kinase